MDKLPHQTLHFHTNISDGSLTYEQGLSACKKFGFGTVAFTDHDYLMEPGKLQELQTHWPNIKIISGIEATAGYLDDQKTVKIPGFHVTGLFVNPTNVTLRNFSHEQERYRLNQAQKMTDKLQNYGFKINFDEIKNVAQTSFIGRPHIAKTLLGNPKNKKILQLTLQQMRSEAKKSKTVARKYQLVRKHQDTQLVFDLFLDNQNPYIKGIYVPSENYITMNQAVSLIRGAGGLAFIAHYSTYRTKFDLQACEDLAKSKKIDGFETVYGFWDSGAEFDQDKSDCLALASVCDKYGLSQSGGVDCHQESDLQKASDKEHIDWLQKTQGLAEKIIKQHPELDLTWSSFSR